MKPYSKILGTLLFSILLLGCSQPETQVRISKDDFTFPPQNVKVHTWWHWLDGAITKEGITKDLESMKKQGISQATILNIGLFNGKNFGVTQIKFNTPEWYEMFEWALQKADSLGISIGAHNCDGWSTSGGPWITPEKSMKQFVWTKTYLSGGKNDGVILPKPQSVRDFYNDVAVLAYRSGDGQSSFRMAQPSVTSGDSINSFTLYDGCPTSTLRLARGSNLQFDFGQPFTAEKIAIHPRQVFMWEDMSTFSLTFDLFASSDGHRFTKVSEIETVGMNKTFQFAIPSTRARYFRIQLNEKSKSRSVALGELELLKKNENPAYNSSIPFHLEKTASVKPDNMSCFDKIQSEQTISQAVSERDIIDISDKMGMDGILNWDAPEGNWKVIRFGYTSTGATNGPATAEGRGLECDKMDTSALNLHFSNYPQKLIDHAGKYAGNTFKFLLIDSWECGYQNWTGRFKDEFKSRRGYDMTNFIPVLCGETVDDPGTSEAFLYDFRKTISDLIGENYYGHFKELCHSHNLEYHAEAIYGELNYPPLDIMKANSYIDLPMFEFWANVNDQTFINYVPSARPELSFPAASAVVYDKPVIGTEAYTGMAHYSETPQALKPYGDRAYCMGLNQIILHSNVHQPLDAPAGMTLGPFAAHFNRLNPWWQFASGWTGYQSRIQYILQKGTVIKEVLYYVGDQLPQTIENPVISTLPFGYSGQACNADALMNMVSVKDGKLLLKGKLEYSMLILPASNLMDIETLERIEELVKQGAIIYGSRPERMLSLKDNKEKKEEFSALVTKLWGDDNAQTRHSYGNGAIFHGKPVGDVLADENVLPAISTGEADSLNLMFIHKSVGDQDVFFVFNQQNKPLYRECLFLTKGKLPELWDPDQGTVYRPAVFTIEGEQVRIPVSFKPRESKIFIFSVGSDQKSITRVTKGETQLFPVTKDLSEPVPDAVLSGNSIIVSADSLTGYRFYNESMESVPVKFLEKREIEITDFAGTVQFEPPYPQKIKSLDISTLSPLNESEVPDIRYFSGTTMYSITFDLPEDFLASCDSFCIGLNVEHATAEARLNGVSVGIAWKPGMSFPVPVLKQTGNELVITMGNPYRNRMIGDFREYGELKNVSSSAKVSDFLQKDKPLLENGLMPPLKVTGYIKSK